MLGLYLGLILLLFLPYESRSQKGPTRVRPYLNVGYVTNLAQGCSDCDKRAGGSIRVGILTKSRFGLYAGYVWYNVDQYQKAIYEDRGSVLLLGLDFRLSGSFDFQWYLQAGMAYDRFISEYPNRTETETSLIPQLGCLFIIKKFNTYVGMGGDNFNVGVGYTF